METHAQYDKAINSSLAKSDDVQKCRGLSSLSGQLAKETGDKQQQLNAVLDAATRILTTHVPDRLRTDHERAVVQCRSFVPVPHLQLSGVTDPKVGKYKLHCDMAWSAHSKMKQLLDDAVQRLELLKTWHLSHAALTQCYADLTALQTALMGSYSGELDDLFGELNTIRNVPYTDINTSDIILFRVRVLELRTKLLELAYNGGGQH